MLPAHFHDVITIYHDLEIKFCAGVKHEIPEQSKNDKDHATSNNEQNTSMKRVQQEKKEHKTIPQCFSTSSLHRH